MARQPVRHQITQFLGQDSGGNRDGMLPGKGRLVYNFYVDNRVLKKIPGTTLYINSGIGTAPVKFISIFQYKWIYQIGQNLIIETAENSQLEKLIASDFDKARIFSDEWQGRIYFANGVQLRAYDGTNLGELGILPPGNGSVPRGTITTNNIGTAIDGIYPQFFAGGGPAPQLPAGTYDYTFTYFDPLTNTESLPIGSLVSSDGLFNPFIFDATVANSNPTGWVYFTVAPGTTFKLVFNLSAITFQVLFGNRPSRATRLNLYRRDPATSSFKLVTTFNLTQINSISYTDNALLASLGPTLIPDQLTPPPVATGAINGGGVGSVGPKYIRFWRDSLWAFGASFPGYTVIDSTKGVSQLNTASTSVLYASDTLLPDYYPFNYFAGRADGQLPTGLAIAYDTLMAFKQRSIYVILGTDLTNFVLKVLDPVRGCIADGSLQEVPQGAIFLAEDGICVCNGQAPAVKISQEIDDEIQNINLAAVSSICSEYDRFNSKYTMYFPTGTGTSNTRYVQYNLLNNTWAVGSRNSVTSSKFGAQSNLSGNIMLGKMGGRIVSALNRAIPADDGQAIYAIFRSDEFDFGRRGERKRLSWLYVTAACSTDYTIDIRVYADYAQGPVYELLSINSGSYWSEYASGTSDPAGAFYDIDRYGAPQTPNRIKIPIQGVGRTFYVEIVEHQNNAQNVLFDIYSIEVEGEVLGK